MKNIQYYIYILSALMLWSSCSSDEPNINETSNCLLSELKENGKVEAKYYWDDLDRIQREEYFRDGVGEDFWVATEYMYNDETRLPSRRISIDSLGFEYSYSEYLYTEDSLRINDYTSDSLSGYSIYHFDRSQKCSLNKKISWSAGLSNSINEDVYVYIDELCSFEKKALTYVHVSNGDVWTYGDDTVIKITRTDNVNNPFKYLKNYHRAFETFSTSTLSRVWCYEDESVNENLSWNQFFNIDDQGYRQSDTIKYLDGRIVIRNFAYTCE